MDYKPLVLHPATHWTSLPLVHKSHADHWSCSSVYSEVLETDDHGDHEGTAQHYGQSPE